MFGTDSKFFDITVTRIFRKDSDKEFSRFYPDAVKYLRCFSNNGGQQNTRNYWNLAAKSVLRRLRFTPPNSCPTEALTPCEKEINNVLFEHGKFQICQCDAAAACPANKQIQECFQDSL